MNIHCPASFSIAGTAGYYSQIAGVLAGFAFLGITLVLTRDNRSKPDSSLPSGEPGILLALFCAFVGLVIAAVEYAIIAGEQCEAQIDGRAPSEELLAGVAFVFSIFILLYSIFLFVAHFGADSALLRNVEVLFLVIAPALAIFFLMLGASDIAHVQHPHHPASKSLINWVNWASDIVPLAVLGSSSSAAVVAWLRDRRNQNSPRRKSLDWRDVLIPYVSLGLTLAAVVRSTMLSAYKPSDRISTFEIWFWPLACVAALAGFAWFVAIVRPQSRFAAST